MIENIEKIEKYVLTVMPDICEANGKDHRATELLEKMKTYGKVEPFEQVATALTAEYQEALGNLTKQLTVIKSQELTEDEIALLNSYRSCKKVNGDKYQARIDALENQLENIRADHQKKVAQITELLTR